MTLIRDALTRLALKNHSQLGPPPVQSVSYLNPVLNRSAIIKKRDVTAKLSLCHE